MAATHVRLITSEPRYLRCVTCSLLTATRLARYQRFLKTMNVAEKGLQQFGQKKRQINKPKDKQKLLARVSSLITETLIIFCRIKESLSVVMIAGGSGVEESSVCPWELSGPDSVVQNVLYSVDDLSLGFFSPHAGLGWTACLI